MKPGWSAVLRHVLRFSGTWIAGLMLLPTARFLALRLLYSRMKRFGADEQRLLGIDPRLLRTQLYLAWMRCLLFTGVAYAALGYYHRPLRGVEVCCIFAVLFFVASIMAYRDMRGQLFP